MNPADYSEEILNTTFATFIYRDERFEGNGHYLKCKFMMWWIPNEFTMRQARDGIKYKENQRGAFEFKLSDSKLEKLRIAVTANDNRVVPLNSDVHRHNILYASVLPEQNKDYAIQAAAELELVTKQIAELVGPLLARQKELKEIISVAKKGPETIVVDGKEKLAWS